MRIAVTVLVVVGIAGVAFGTAGYMHPDGMNGFLADLGLAGRKTTLEPTADSSTPTVEVGKSRKRFDELVAKGHAAYDKARFASASTNYLLATAAAPTPNDEEVAQRSLHRALLARFLVEDSQTTVDGDPRAEYDRLAREAQSSPTEARWMAAAQVAATYGFRSETVHATEQALSGARRGGDVGRRLMAALSTAGSMQKHLEAAIRGAGLFGSSESSPTASGIGGAETVDPDDEASGIGSVGNRGIPFGSFDEDMRRQLARAVELQKVGEYEYDLAGPEQEHRGRHRRIALGNLQEARDIYSNALDMDPDSKDVQRRMRKVMQMIAGLRKHSTSD